MMGGRGKSYDEPRDMAGRRLPSSSEDESSSSDDDSVPRRKRYVEKPHHRAGRSPRRSARSAKRACTRAKKCPTCGECFGTAKAGGAHAERWKHIQSHASGNTEADVTILRVEELRERLESRGLSSEGLKKELQARLLAEYRKPPGDPAADAAAAAAAADARRAAPRALQKARRGTTEKASAGAGQRTEEADDRAAEGAQEEERRRRLRAAAGGEASGRRRGRAVAHRARGADLRADSASYGNYAVPSASDPASTPSARHHPSPVASSAGAPGQPEEGRLGAAVCQVHGRDHCQGIYMIWAAPGPT